MELDAEDMVVIAVLLALMAAFAYGFYSMRQVANIMLTPAQMEDLDAERCSLVADIISLIEAAETTTSLARRRRYMTKTYLMMAEWGITSEYMLHELDKLDPAMAARLRAEGF